MKNTRVAVDVGGTFTDICVMDEHTGRISIEKTSSTVDPIEGILNAVDKSKVDLNQVSLFSHGTTVATNALITRRLPRTAMICTEGFRDVIEIRRANKEDLWDIYKDVAPPHVKRRDRLCVAERIDAQGKVVTALDVEQAKQVARTLRRREVKAVAICFMNAYMNPQHEQEMRDILRAEMPDVAISLSSEVMPEIFEHERFSTTVINAACSPVVVDYTKRLGQELKHRGYESDLLLLHSGGGVMTTEAVEHFSARLAGSGIAAGAIASRHIAMLCGFRNSIGLDMGGTSTDVSLAYDGQSRITNDWFIEFGYPIRFASIEVLTIGAGGGSLAWQDEAGSLRNGPQSAGANPGPACYGNGNMQPTNTDANVVLGRLGTRLAGGQVTLNASLAHEAVKQGVAEPFKLELHDAAQAIIDVANANMADAVRLLSISRGYDPRDFALVSFGGAGALHGVAIAQELSIPAVIVPPNPGVASALGCLLVNIQHDFAESYIKQASEVDIAELEAAFQRLEAEAISHLSHEGVQEENMVLERTIDMMYQGQWRSLAIPTPRPVKTLDSLIEIFHQEHEREYNYRRMDAPVSVFRLNLKAVGLVAQAELPRHEPTGVIPTPASHREVWFSKFGACHTPVYERTDLPAGFTLQGPAVIEQLDSTVVVPPQCRADIDNYLNIIIRF
ncbi:hydantoinase/oxoprolinase family protein [Paenalcaligenes sp. Me131]|uniref:hydantoinase/oxoprolinase family protein n=1 Tax=Paenalcaligenes sp. Me131 TaxID=3392636 RepID=UPI003D265F54